MGGDFTELEQLAVDYFLSTEDVPSAHSRLFAYGPTQVWDPKINKNVNGVFKRSQNIAGCYSLLTYHQRLNEWKIIALNFLETKANREYALPYFDWIMGPTSPWRNLFKNDPVKKILRGDKLIGFIVPRSMYEDLSEYDTVKRKAWNNWAICSRINEHEKRIKLWWEVQKEGLTPEEAFFLASVVTPLLDKEYQLIKNASNHWGVSPETFSLKLFKAGQFNPSSYTRMDTIWSNPLNISNGLFPILEKKCNENKRLTLKYALEGFKEYLSNAE